MIGAFLGLIGGMVLGRVFTPDDFATDWYGWLTNQLGHIFVMLAALAIVVSATAWLWEVPTQTELAISGAGFCAAFQFVQWRQGGTVLDSIEDALFMAYGWVPACYLFKVGADNLPKLQSLVWLSVALAAVSFHLCYGVAKRWK